MLKSSCYYPVFCSTISAVYGNTHGFVLQIEIDKSPFVSEFQNQFTTNYNLNTFSKNLLDLLKTLVSLVTVLSEKIIFKNSKEIKSYHSPQHLSDMRRECAEQLKNGQYVSYCLFEHLGKYSRDNTICRLLLFQGLLYQY